MYKIIYNTSKTIGFAFISFLVLIACKKEKTETELSFPKLDTCEAAVAQSGLNITGDSLYIYTSSGGAVIQILRTSMEILEINLKYIPFENFKYTFWGDGNTGTLSPASHENLNGKHVKDRFGVNRSVIFPDGTKMTYVSTGAWNYGGITAITLYDGDKVHHFNMTCNELEYSGSHPSFSKYLDENQADGETSSFEITGHQLVFFNIYDEDKIGEKIYKRVNIGIVYKDEINRVDDLFDDERLPHT